MASTSDSPSSQHEVGGIVPFPKPPTPDPATSSPNLQLVADITNIVPPSVDPPPPYPAGTRTGRRARGNTGTGRNSRRAAHPSDDSQMGTMSPDSGGESETSPLLGPRRRRTTSHSSTIHSVQSLAHTVFHLFQAEPGEGETLPPVTPSSSAPIPSDLPFFQRAKRYFRPMARRAYYAALFHLLVLNFPYELGAWIFLFVGTLTGTTLLITLPLGAILCFLDLLGARVLGRGEIALQTRFHGPLSANPPRRPIFARMRTPTPSESQLLESGSYAPAAVPETSFLRLAYLMFRDPTSYQALFYFLVIKPGLTLLITLALIVLVPPAFILIVPAPAVLRAVRRVGIWQAEVAIDALG